METPKYDPAKKYQWEPTTEFTFNGEEFALVLNTFRAILASGEYQRMQLVERANQKMEANLSKAVESGKVREMLPEEPKEKEA